MFESPAIAALSEGIQRPFWSVMIPVYHGAEYLEIALQSLLEQAPEPERMQIEVVDDCSTEDDPEAVVQRVGHGRIAFFRQPRNVGAVRNFNTCLQRATGHWIHLLNGDDVVLAGFYAAYECLIQRYPEAALLTSPAIHIDAAGHPTYTSRMLAPQCGMISGFPERQAIRNSIRTPSVVLPRRVYEQIGGYCPQLPYTADWELYFRAGCTGPAVTAAEPLSCYREHVSNFTSRVMRTGQNIEEAVLTVERCCQQLPLDIQQSIRPEQYYWVTKMALQNALRCAYKQEWRACFMQFHKAIPLLARHFHPHWFVCSSKLIWTFCTTKKRPARN